MISGIDLTIKVISQSKNQAVAGLLESAFHSTSELMRKLAGKLLVSRRAGQGLEAIIRDFDPSDQYLVDLVKDNRDKLIPGLRGAIVDEDTTLARQAYRLAYTQNFYEVLPTLVTFCLGPGSQDRTGLTLTADLLKFIDKYSRALEKNEAREHHLLYNSVLPELVKILNAKIKEYRFKPNELTLAVFLRLYPFFSEAEGDFFSEAEGDLKRALRFPSSPVYVAAYRRLLTESDDYLFQFITRCLDRLNPPPLISQVIAERADIPFLKVFFKSICPPLPLELKTNLSRLTPPVWIGQIDSFLNKFDTEAQCGLVLLLQNLPLKENELQSSLLKIFEHGKEAGRVAALSALSAFTGVEIDRIVWNASGDEDPAVQIEALTKMNEREIPGTVSRIMQFAESPHEEVRDTVLKLLPNFRFSRLMQTFDQLPDETRRKMFNVVRQIDKNTPKEMSKLLTIGDQLQKAKALLCAGYCNEIVPLIEDAMCDVLIHGETPMLRSKAAQLLVAGRRDTSRTTLVQALHRDTSPEVRSAAKESLEKRPTYWKENEHG